MIYQAERKDPHNGVTNPNRLRYMEWDSVSKLARRIRLDGTVDCWDDGHVWGGPYWGSLQIFKEWAAGWSEYWEFLDRAELEMDEGL